ncbi:hypothetical protein [Thiomonas sp.]
MTTTHTWVFPDTARELGEIEARARQGQIRILDRTEPRWSAPQGGLLVAERIPTAPVATASWFRRVFG